VCPDLCPPSLEIASRAASRLRGQSLTLPKFRNTFLVVSDVTLKVNGRSHTIDVDPSTPLLYALSDDLGLRGPKFGCGLGQCGACTVILNGQAVRSCITPVQTMASAEITTLEGIGTPEKPHPLQQAFIDEQAAQCGFCLNAVIMTAKAFLDKNPKPTDAQLQEALSGVLCRCFVHARMFRAIQRASKEMAR
jgi:nicotinate dehydrogenase subunit A